MRDLEYFMFSKVVFERSSRRMFSGGIDFSARYFAMAAASETGSSVPLPPEGMKIRFRPVS